MTEQLSLATATDVAETIPSLMGYQPTERVVVACLRDRRLVCGIAVDAAAPVTAARDAVRKVLDATDAAIVVVYSDRTEAHQLATDVVEQLQAMVHVIDGIVVTRYAVESQATGQSQPRSTTPSAAQVQAVVAGLPQPATSRDELEKRYLSDPELVAQRQQLAPLTSTSSLPTEVLAALGQPMTAQTAARLGHALTEDALSEQWASLPPNLAAQALALWSQVAAYYSDTEPTSEANRILSLCGLCAYLTGSPVALGAILDRLHRRTRAGVMDQATEETRRLLTVFADDAIRPARFIEARDRITNRLH